MSFSILINVNDKFLTLYVWFWEHGTFVKSDFKKSYKYDDLNRAQWHPWMVVCVLEVLKNGCSPFSSWTNTKLGVLMSLILISKGEPQSLRMAS